MGQKPEVKLPKPIPETGVGDAITFFGLSLDIRTELVLILVNDAMVEPILSTIKEAGRFSEPGTGIVVVSLWGIRSAAPGLGFW